MKDKDDCPGEKSLVFVKIAVYCLIEKNSNEVLKEGLDSLTSLCDVLNDKFDAAMKKFEKQ